MFSFAKNIVRTLEHTAESVISGGPQDDSVISSDAYFQHAKMNKQALRIVNVVTNSEAHSLRLESWFDFIIGINGHEIPTSYDEFGQLKPNYQYLVQEIANCHGRSVTFEVWSAKGGAVKYIELPVEESNDNTMSDVPLDGNKSDLQSQEGLYKHFGLQVQWSPLITSTFVYHVLEIHPNSPAQHAGLVEYSDYIIGSQDGLLATGGEDLLGRVIDSKRGQAFILYVYNSDYNVVRPVTITPADNWGGVGLLGCNVGYGLLHRIPSVTAGVEPGSVLFDNQYVGSPAPQVQQISLPSPPPPHQSLKPSTSNDDPAHPFTQQIPHASRKKKTAAGANTDMLDYLKQESDKSRELDHHGKGTSDPNSSLPPPPKK